jgi:hypothetical protein
MPLFRQKVSLLQKPLLYFEKSLSIRQNPYAYAVLPHPYVILPTPTPFCHMHMDFSPMDVVLVAVAWLAERGSCDWDCSRSQG